MKTILRLCFLIQLLTAPAPLPAQKVPPQPLYTVDLSKVTSQELDINPAGTLTFLTERTLAASLCRNLRCYLETLDLEAGKPRVIAKSDEFQNYSALFRAPGGRVILNRARSETEWGAVLFDSNLHAPKLITQAAGIHESNVSTTGDTFVKQDRSDWVAYKMGQPPQRIRAGTGRVLSLSDKAVAYVDQGTLQIEEMDGRHLGSFAVLPRDLPTIRFIGRDRLWSETGSHSEILDFNGKVVQTLERPEGWGFRIGQSSDGHLILFDRYTRHVPLCQKVGEAATAIATLGTGVGDEEANGETVLVINTRNGKPCFEWSGSANVLVAGQLHGDIDPSGRLIAVMTRTTLNIYKVPEDCGAN